MVTVWRGTKRGTGAGEEGGGGRSGRVTKAAKVVSQLGHNKERGEGERREGGGNFQYRID